MRLLPLALLVGLTTSAAAIKAAPPPDPPHVLALSQSEKAGDYTSKIALYEPAGAETVILDQMPLASMALAVHEATGRWAVTFGQLPNGDPLTIDGRTVSKPNDRNTLVLGDLAGVTAAVYGDKACTSKKTACFETPLLWSTDGAYVYVRSEASSWGVIDRWSFGKKPKLAAITGKKPGALSIAPDLASAAYFGKDGIHVVKFPAPKKKPKKIKASKKAVVDPSMVMGGVYPIGGKLYWFRREPTEQKRGYFESYDLATKETKVLLEAKADYYMPRGDFLADAPRGSVLFGYDTNFERADVYEAAADGSVSLVTRDVLQLLDVSPDGRYALVTKRKDPPKLNIVTNPEQLVIVDLERRQDIYVIDTGGDGRKITGAAFVAAP